MFFTIFCNVISSYTYTEHTTTRNKKKDLKYLTCHIIKNVKTVHTTLRHSYVYLGNIVVKNICVSMLTKSCDDRKRVNHLMFIAICQTDRCCYRCVMYYTVMMLLIQSYFIIEIFSK